MEYWEFGCSMGGLSLLCFGESGKINCKWNWCCDDDGEEEEGEGEEHQGEGRYRYLAAALDSFVGGKS